ncbi:hypothetical protein [Nostoc sp.]|uniref:hypothetical protein n=1 Tax=Nostoc sp. TaxID=1180 RepID=UPI002FFABFF9
MKTLSQKNKQIEKPSLEYYLNFQFSMTLYKVVNLFHILLERINTIKWQLDGTLLIMATHIVICVMSFKIPISKL